MLQILSCKLSHLCCLIWRDGLWNERLALKWDTGDVCPLLLPLWLQRWEQASFSVLVYRVGPGRIKLTWCFSPGRNQKGGLSLRKCLISPCKQGQDNGPLGTQKSQSVTTDVNNSDILSLSGLESFHDGSNIASYGSSKMTVYVKYF